MIRTTTPRHKFYFPEEAPVAGFSEILVTYAQASGGCRSGQRIVVEKDLSELDLDEEENSISIDLSQAETARFSAGLAEIQIKAKKSGKVVASQIFKIKVKRILSEEEI